MAKTAEILLVLPQQQLEPYGHFLNDTVLCPAWSAPRLRNPFGQVRRLRTIVREIKEFSPDILHVQAVHPWFNSLGLPFLRRSPLVLTVHDYKFHPGDGPSRKTPQCIAQFTYKCANEIIVHSQYVKRQVIRDHPSFEPRIHVVPHIKLGEEPSLKRQSLRQEPTVLFFGRIWGYKGLEYLIRAEPIITSEVPGAKIIIAGQGEGFSRYRRIMAHPEHFEVYNEFISTSRCSELFLRASVVVLPYIEASQSGVIQLAYTFAKPVVITRVGGLPEMVEDGRTGVCVPARDEAALATAIVRLLSNEALQRQLGANGNRKINAECSPDLVAERTMSVYRNALDEATKNSCELISRASNHC